ncbi:UNVERIFIED_CONTAM: hypothetical protein NCL1_13633 [Trichonephila clavipes]
MDQESQGPKDNRNFNTRLDSKNDNHEFLVTTTMFKFQVNFFQASLDELVACSLFYKISVLSIKKMKTFIYQIKTVSLTRGGGEPGLAPKTLDFFSV